MVVLASATNGSGIDPEPSSSAGPSVSPTPTPVSSKVSTVQAQNLDNGDYRVAVFGAGGVGKSSIVLRFVKGTFNDSYIPTIEDTYQQVSFIQSILFLILRNKKELIRILFIMWDFVKIYSIYLRNEFFLSFTNK